MTMLNWRCGVNDDPSTKITVWLKTNDGLNHDVTINGVTVSTPTNGGDNTGFRTQGGLAPNTAYEIKIAGVVVGSVKTFPVPGAPVRIMGTNCTDKKQNFGLGKVVTDRDPDLFMWQGDNGYSHHIMTRYRDDDDNPLSTIACDAPVNASTPTPRADWYNNHRMFESIPGVKRVNRLIPNLAILSNHDRGGGIDDLGVLSYYATGAAMANQGVANNCYAEAIAAAKAYRPDPPFEPPPATRDVAEWVKTAAFTDADFDPRYYSFICGCVEIFVTDTISGKGKNNQADALNEMYGPEQEAWLIAGVNASTQPWKMIVSAQGLTDIPFGPTDWSNGWHERQTQLHRIIDAFNLASTVGIVWAGADWHAPSLQVGHGAYKYAASNMGPGSIEHNISAPAFTLAEGGDLIYGGETQNSPLNQSNVGQFDFTPTLLTLTGVNVRNQETLKVTMNSLQNVFNEGGVVTITHPVAYDHVIDNPAHVGRNDPTTYITNEATVSVHGWGTPPGTGTQDMGASFQSNLAAGVDVRAAVLELDILGTANFNNLRILIDEPKPATLNPWGVGYLPRDMQKATPWLPIESFEVTQAGLVRIDVTNHVQQALLHGSYAIGHYFNFNLYFLGGNDDVDIAGLSAGGSDGKPPRLVVQTID